MTHLTIVVVKDEYFFDLDF